MGTPGEHREDAGSAFPTKSPTVGSADVPGRWTFSAPQEWHKGLATWDKPHSVYVVAAGDTLSPVKIGITNNITQRLWSLSSGNPLGARLIAREEVGHWLARQVERHLHALFHDRALGREWFNVEATEAVTALERLSGLAREAVPDIRAEIALNDWQRRKWRRS